jgi:transcription antitermination factor NusG
MSVTATGSLGSGLAPLVTSAILEPRWYAAYTCAHHEKRVAAQLAHRSVEHFLPLYGSMRRWKDRRLWLQMPLFPGYVFVRLTPRDRLKVLEVPGVVRLVSFNGVPAPLPDQEIEAIRIALFQDRRAEPYRFLTAGRKVQVKSGPLTGLRGIFIRRKGRTGIVLSMQLIQRAIMVDLEGADIEVLAVRGDNGEGQI